MPRPSSLYEQIPRSGIRTIFDAAARIPDVISLAVGEPAETADPHVVAAANAAQADGHTKYSNVLGLRETRDAASAYTARVKELRYSPETETQIVPGATFGLYLATLSVVNPGDEVIVPTPAFPSYDAQIALAGGCSVHVPLRPENGMRLSAHDITRAITPRTRAILINTPGNPSGAVTNRAQLAQIAELCVRHDLWAISDEVYHAFDYTSPDSSAAPSIAAAPGMRERTVVVESLSKTFAMTGWRIGYLHAPAPVIEHSAAMAELLHSSVNSGAQYAATAALSGPLTSVRRRAATYRANRDILARILQNHPTVHMIPSEGAFYALLDIHRTGMTGTEFAHRLLEQEHVAVVPGEAFGAAHPGLVRVSYVGDSGDLCTAVNRIVEFADIVTRDRSQVENARIPLAV
ncbi:MAG TPA: aminotransferase class I/II-fold pyridoxal phosphate-dependent enzyme [Pseudoclavibacter sp.]|nr:aminotransferase class I/II-fold pyridoxal phosphate-dependent enzyme [Pseudoclavibacter sp.]